MIYRQSLNTELPADARAWFYTRYENPRGRWYPKIAKWETHTLRLERINHGDFDSVRYFYVDRMGHEHGRAISDARIYGIQPYKSDGKNKTDAELLALTARKANRVYSDWLKHEEDSLRWYIAWQTARVVNWKKTDLLPVESKSKLGFVPTKPAY